MPSGLNETPAGFVDPACPINWDHPLNKGLVSWWNAVPNTGWSFSNTFRDASRGGKTSHDATLASSPVWAVSPTSGRMSVRVTGGSSINAPNWANLVAGDFLIRVIHRPTSWPGTYTALFDKGTSGTARELSIFVDTSGNLSYGSVGDTSTGSGGQVLLTTTGMTAGSWWDFVLTRSGSTCSVYVNGLLKGTFTSSLTGAAASLLSFGANPSTGGSTYSGSYYQCQYYASTKPSKIVYEMYRDYKTGNVSTLNWVGAKSYAYSPEVAPATGNLFRNANLSGLQGGGPFFVNPLGG